MNGKKSTKDLVIAGLMLALSIVIPSIFHGTGINGKVFLPMHIPVLLAGFLLPPSLAILVGIIAPFLNSLVTGMPVLFPMAIIMSLELGTYALLASVLTKKVSLSVIPSLVISMIIGRIVAGLTVFVLVILFGVDLDPILFVKGGILTGWPGILIQIIIVPTIMHFINRYTTINMD